MGRFTRLAVFVLLFSQLDVRAGELPKADPTEVGLSSEALSKLTQSLRKLVDDGQIAGGVAVVARHGKVAYLRTFGYRDLASKAPMTDDTIFAIASMTKPITCTAVMTLVEEGKLGLDDPVSKFIPELKEMRVLGHPKDDTPTEAATVPAKRQITIRDLLSHSSGFAYGGVLSFNARLGKSYNAPVWTR